MFGEWSRALQVVGVGWETGTMDYHFGNDALAFFNDSVPNGALDAASFTVRLLYDCFMLVTITAGCFKQSSMSS
jgi:hypothetical protein